MLFYAFVIDIKIKTNFKVQMKTNIDIYKYQLRHIHMYTGRKYDVFLHKI